jgi:2-oxoglutarate dehydrogenase E2 component (dihydrolipoamide succinyltransferase)
MSSEVEIRAPAEQTEGTRSQILRWLKSVGESVTENEPLIELETDKVTVEVPSPGSGILREIRKQEQDEIGPGELLGLIEVAGAETVRGVGGAATALGATHPATASAAARAPGNGDGGPLTDLTASSSPAESGSGATRESTAAMEGASDAGIPGHAAQILSPAVRRLLSERSLDPSAVRGTGKGGRITVADVLAHGAHPGPAPTVSVTGADVPGRGDDLASDDRADVHASAVGAQSVGAGNRVSAGMSAADGASAANSGQTHAATASRLPVGAGSTDVAGGSHRVPHTATRKRIAEHMVQSLLHTAPHVTTVFEADLTAVLEHRQRHKEDFARRGAPLTLTAYFLRATVAAIRLVVPVLRDVQSLDLFETAKGLDDLVTRTREGHLTPADVRGGTFTISNHGVSGSLVATPIIINQPQSAILGVGKLEKRPVVITSADGEDRIVIRPRCYVTLTIDHRVMDGNQANRFLQTFVERLAKPE